MNRLLRHIPWIVGVLAWLGAAGVVVWLWP